MEDLVERSLIGERRHVDIIIPRTTVRAKMRLVSRGERFDAIADARRALAQAGMPIDASAVAGLGSGESWNYELAVRLLAIAVRDPDNTTYQLATVEEWRECDDEQLDALYAQFTDLVAELDPLGENGPGLSPEELAALTAAAKKGDVTVLMSYGSRKLALWARTSAAQPATSPTPPS